MMTGGGSTLKWFWRLKHPEMPRKAAACDTSPDIKRSTVQPKDDLNPANCPIFASAGSQGNLGWIDMDSVAPYMTYDPMNQYFGRGI